MLLTWFPSKHVKSHFGIGRPQDFNGLLQFVDFKPNYRVNFSQCSQNHIRNASSLLNDSLTGQLWRSWGSSQFKSVRQGEINASYKSNLFMGMWINKLQPMGALASAGQMGQHSPDGMIGLAQSLMSSQIISSHKTAPLSHTQIRHGSGFHTSLSLYWWPSWMQPPTSSVVASRGRKARRGWEQQLKEREVEGKLSQCCWSERMKGGQGAGRGNRRS